MIRLAASISQHINSSSVLKLETSCPNSSLLTAPSLLTTPSLLMAPSLLTARLHSPTQPQLHPLSSSGKNATIPTYLIPSCTISTGVTSGFSLLRLPIPTPGPLLWSHQEGPLGVSSVSIHLMGWQQRQRQIPPWLALMKMTSQRNMTSTTFTVTCRMNRLRYNR